MAKPIDIDQLSNVYEQSIEEIMHNSMMPYSEYVILERALPRVEDGLKPVHRRILYAMHEMGLTPDKPHRKCAAIVGECLGKYHPHGDSSVYDALVRMAQPFNMSMMLVDGHGNFGSVDGDSAAAMRYTEARLMPLAMEMLKDIEKDTVSWTNNYDDRLKEPESLPSRYPNILVNGASGIAVGMATDIPPHNISEVIEGTIAIIDNKRLSLDELMKYIPAPDLPTGGYIVDMDGIRSAYETGRGKLLMRAKLHIENADNDKKNIVITELPYQVNKAQLLLKIATLREEKKNVLLSGIQDVVDESDRKGMRAVIKLKRDADIQGLLNYLYKSTNLQYSTGINMVAIAGGKPKQMGIMEILHYYIEYQRNLIVKRSQYDLNVAQVRAEVIEGLLIAIANIDEVIAIIKSSNSVSDAKSNLKKRFMLTERQVSAILEMRIARLVKLEIEKLNEEIKQLKEQISKLKAIIANKKLQYEVIKTELRDIKKRFKQHRRTTLLTGDEINCSLSSNVCEGRCGVLCLNPNGTIKFVNERAFDTAVRGHKVGYSYDIVKQAFTITTDICVLAFTNKGNCCKLYFNEYEHKKWNYKGDKLQALCSDAAADEYIVKLMPLKDEYNGEMYLYTLNGYVKKCNFSDLVINKDYYQVITIKDNDEVINVECVLEGHTIFFATSEGMFLNAETDDIPVQGRKAGGVYGIQLNDNDKVVSAMQINEDGEIVVVTDRGYAKRLIIGLLAPSKRYRKGLKLYDLKDKYARGILACHFVQQPVNLGLIYNDDKVCLYNSNDIPIESRASRGVLMLPDEVMVADVMVSLPQFFD